MENAEPEEDDENGAQEKTPKEVFGSQHVLFEEIGKRRKKGAGCIR
ncbi:MAG: hypothetical protein PHS02_00535 [Candidatus ainarchaeum sp.]|nr:hypothetical protein [Candidatus ainarchaeum sp.]